MYFKRLELLGFKSFADKTALDFEPGITAVVGPNGCGKSNIFDSIRWVLGEQSVKSLRGAKMEDVIFNGTDKKEPINFAEVSLTFSNESKMLPIDYNEVTVTRRLFRSGESEYLLNNTQVRLKDILELFMGTGIGAEAYSLVEQGKIDLVLSSRPEDRRMIFDEASGITKYKAKKKETMRKLEDVEANLLRVNDIVVEVKRQIGSVERQAEKARKYQEQFEKLKALELKFGLIQLNDLKKEIEGLNKKFEESQSGDQEITSKINELNNLLKEIQLELAGINSQVESFNSDRFATNNSIERDNDYIKLNRERILEIESRQKEIEANIIQLTESVRTQEENYSVQKKIVDTLSESRLQKENELKENEDKLAALDNQIKEANLKIKLSKELILDLNANQINVRNELSDVVAGVNSSLNRKHRIEVELNQVKDEKQKLEGSVHVVSEECEKLAQSLNNLEQEFRSFKSKIDDLEKEKDDLITAINELEKEKAARESQLQFLEDLKVRYQEFPSKKALLTYSGNVPEDVELILAKIIHKTDSADFKDSVRKHLNEESEVQAVVCEARFIALNSEKIKLRLSEIETLLNTDRNKIIVLNNEIENLKNQIPAKEILIKEAQMAYANKASEKQAQDEEINKLNEEVFLLNLEISEVLEEIKSAKEKEINLSHRLEDFKKQEEETNNAIIENQELIQIDSQEREDCLISVTQLKTEIESWSSREKAQLENLLMIERSLNSNKEALELRKKETAANQERKDKLSSEIVNLETEIADLTSKLRLIERNVNEYIERRKKINENIVKIEAEASGLLEKLEVIRNNSRDVQLSLQDKNFKIQGLKERINQVYKIDIENTIFDDLASFDIEQAKPEIEQLKQKVESFGTVNLVAIEEFDELRQRYEFLTKQQQDLFEAKDSLLKAIAKINRTTRQMFIDTFHKVNEEFKNYFRLLFGGGDAQLILLDENDVLESGIEIICRPPGKKLQNVLLLSGGEKSLSAIALIFAIFKVRPSPFCILDEIDAALDESNVGRFSRMVQDFSKIAQFIMITHNKKTISSANVMYGITMEESGVSKIVSVKFGDNKEKEKAQELETQPVAS